MAAKRACSSLLSQQLSSPQLEDMTNRCTITIHYKTKKPHITRFFKQLINPMTGADMNTKSQ